MNTTHEQSGQVPVTKKNKGRRALRWVLTLVGVLLLFVIVTAWALPGILSGGWGKARVLNVINGAISGEVSIAKMKLSWFGSQTMDGVKLVDGDGGEVASVKHVEVPVGLWSLMWGGRDLGTVEVEGPVLMVVTKKEGGTNLMEAVSGRETGTAKPVVGESKEPFKLPVQFKVKVTDGKITMKPVEGADVVFDSVNVTADAGELGKPLTFDLSTLTKQGELSGKVKAVGSVDLASGDVTANADVNDLPVAGLDTLLDQGGLLTAAIGPTLNAHAQITAGAGVTKLEVKAGAANLAVDVNADATKEVMTGVGVVKFTVTQVLARKLAERYGAAGNGELGGDVPVTVTIKKLSLPIGGFEPAKAGMEVSVEIGAGKLAGVKDAGEVSWSDFAALIKSENMAERVQLAANGRFMAAGKSGSLVASADVMNLFDAQGKPAIETAKVDADGTLTDLPVLLVDRLTGQGGKLVEAIGERLSATAIAKSDGKGRIEATINAESPVLSAVLPVVVGKRVTLSAPGSVTYTVPAAVLARYVTETSGYGVTVGQPVTLAIDAFDMPVPGSATGGATDGAKLKPGDVTMKATLRAKDVRVTDGAEAKAGSKVGPLSLPEVVVVLTGEQMDKPTVSVKLNWAASEGLVAEYASKRYAVTVDAATTLDEGFAMGAVSVMVDGVPMTRDLQPLDAMKLAGEISKGFERFKLTTPAGGNVNTVTYRLMGDAMPGVPADGAVMVKLAALDVPLKGFALSGVKAIANVTVPEMVLRGDERIAGTTLRDGAAEVAFDGGANTLKLTANAKTQLPGQASNANTGSIAVNADLKNVIDVASGKVDVMKAVGVATVNVKDLPTAFVDAVAGQGGLIAAALGEKVNVDATLNAPAGGNGSRTADVALHSALMDASGAVSLAEGKAVEVIKPVSVDWTMQPAAYAKLMGDEAALMEPVKVNGAIKQLSWPMPGSGAAGGKNALAGAKVEATFGVGKLSLKPRDATGTATVSGLQIAANSADLSKSLNASASGQIGYVEGAGEPVTGKLDATATLSEMFDAAGKMNVEAMNAVVKATLADVPTASLDALGKQKGLIKAALGEKVTIGADATLRGGKGPVVMTLASPLASAKVPAELNAGVMTLTDTMTASFMMTEELSKKLIDHPLLKQAIRSEQPVKLVVQKDGFSLPLSMLMSDDAAVKQKGIEAIAIAKATIEPGKLVVNNAGLINTLVTLPDTVGKLARLKIGEALAGLKQNEIVAWFTPMEIQMKQGVLAMSRMDMLLGENYQVATWGVINMADRAQTVNGVQLPGKTGDMVLGITERALRRIYGITSFKDDPNYVDQFVMRGSLDKLGPDEKELASRMVFLTAGGTAAKIGGEKVGGIVGDVLKIGGEIQKTIDPKLKDQKPAPAPYQPYPWPAEKKDEKAAGAEGQTQDAQQTEQTQQTNQNQLQDQNAQQPATEQPKEKPAEKIINDALKDIFGKPKK